MFIIDKNSVSAIRQKLDDPDRAKEVISDVEKMVEIKDALLWRSEVIAPCCGSLCNISLQLRQEISLLNNTLASLKNGDKAQASSLLEEYIRILEGSCEPSQPKYC